MRDVEIVLASARPWFVERIRLHEDCAGGGPERRSLASMLEGTDVRLRIGTIEEIDLDRRRASGEAFDDLVIATGSVERSRGVPGLEHAWSCATEERSLALRAHLAALGGARPRVVVIGGGLTGIELATELAERHAELRVVLVTAGPIAPMLGESARAHVLRTCERLGIEVRSNARVAAVERDGIVLGSGDAIGSDATVWCAGFEATPLAASAGLAVDENGRAYVDGRLRSKSHPFVRVIGDAAHVDLPNPARRPQHLRMACATALPQGAFCADDLALELAGRTPGRELSFAYAAQCVSLGRRNGVVHHVDAYDAPRPMFVAGRPGAWLKELVCRYAFGAVRLERRGIGYAWPSAPALASSSRPEHQLTTRSP